MTHELKLRIISGAVLAAVVLLITWVGGGSFNLLAVIIGLLVFHEWLAMSRARDGQEAAGRWSTPVLGGWAVMIAVAILTLLELFGLALALSCFSAAACWIFARRTAMPFWFAGALIYACASMIALAVLRNGGDAGLFAIMFLFAVVWSTDIMAYFVGRTFKGPKLAPSISPGKTWSGAVGGAGFGVAAALTLCWAYGGSPTIAIGILALFLSVCSQAGDLFESALKRRCGVKDSSHLIPGHGGVMDRVDGLVAAAFAMYVVVVLVALAGHDGFAGDMLMNWSGLAVPTDGA
ncbi:phosphatidate cytidylyltransferase [Martelella soudanensis]|uniref:phosphatidate cytidylyltransferase n=1 Tax=unclassified Martelella TaxID=2629616 RepID=UPI0015DF67D3|nr:MULTISPECIES: phosphatidate cytidylyltransferase [unclassified Martelella]